MFLNAEQIAVKRSESSIVIDPFESDFLKPASYVLRLGNKMRRWKRTGKQVDAWTSDCGADALGSSEPFSELSIAQGELVLVSSYERIGVSDGMLGMIMTLSHLSRLGISVTADSHLVSPGFGSDAACELTFEICSHNPNPVRLRAGLPVCHLLFVPIDVAREKSSLASSVYQILPTPFGPALFEEFARTSPSTSADEQCDN